MIRPAVAADVERMVDLAELRRLQYQAYQPQFWRKAYDSREKHLPLLQRLVADERVIALVAERDGAVAGFLIATLVQAPPVYAPGGPSCYIDDFYVAAPASYEAEGVALLEEAWRLGRERGAAQTVVVCGHLDGSKRAMLAAQGLTIASEWYVRSLAE